MPNLKASSPKSRNFKEKYLNLEFFEKFRVSPPLELYSPN